MSENGTPTLEEQARALLRTLEASKSPTDENVLVWLANLPADFVDLELPQIALRMCDEAVKSRYAATPRTRSQAIERCRRRMYALGLTGAGRDIGWPRRLGRAVARLLSDRTVAK